MATKSILPDFQAFLMSSKLVPEKHIPYYAHWAGKFLAFSNRSRQTDLNFLVAEFFHFLNSEKNIADRQIRQAEEALRFYLHHFKGNNGIKCPCQKVKDVLYTTPVIML